MSPGKTHGILAALGGMLLVTGLCALHAATTPPPPVVSEGSIRRVPAAVKMGPNDPRHPFISRNTLNAAETAADMQFEVALKMRNFAELQARLARGERISFEEMSAKYYPTQADYNAVAAWVKGLGFKIVREDDNRLAIFATASVGNLQKTLRANFARVELEGKEYTSAITPPEIPAALSPLLVGVNGLQPHARAHKNTIPKAAAPNSLTGTAPPYTPAQILHAYGANNLSLTGAGQSIAIVIDTQPLPDDLSNFWSTFGVARTGTYTPMTVVSGTADLVESSLDSEWSSSIAPGANLRVYSTSDLSFANLDMAYQAVFADAMAHPEYGLHQMSMSYGLGETYASASQVSTDSQYFANLASAGVTIFASSGDAGYNPNSSGATGGAIQVESPASDPNVTGVGGTSLTITSGSNINTETAWNGSGGGTSIYFVRPTWQVGTGLPTGNTRCVPDVCLPADPNTGAYTIISGTQQVWGGTSWSSPTWAGFCALINQARANVNLPPVGPLGPKIYPLLGTTSFHDITSGTNGYSTTTGYDLVTGLGSPNMPALVQALLGMQTLPIATTVPYSQNASFVVAGGTGTAYQWQRMPIGTSVWSNLAATGTYSGVASGTLMINAVSPEMSGDQFQCLVTTGTGVVTTAPASTLVVDNPLAVTTLAGRALVSGTADGTGGAALFNIPSGAAVDSAGNVYIADYSSSTIRRVTPSGVVTTPYGRANVTGSVNGTGTNALFNTPNSVAIDSSDNIYVADSSNNTIRKITSAGVVSTFAGRPGRTGTVDGTGTSARFNNPQGIAVDGTGAVYVADTVNETIRKITPAGVVTTLAGTPGVAGYLNATGTAAKFNGPINVGVDSLGNVYVTDLYNYVVRGVSPAGVVSTAYGEAGAPGRLDGIGTSAQFNAPIGLAVDHSNNIYVTDSQVPPTLTSPSSGNNTLRRINPAGVVSTIAGTPGVTGAGDGTGPAAQFYSLQGVAVSGQGVVYLADTFNQTVRAGGIAPLVTTLAGTQTVNTGQSVTLSVSAVGSGTVSYQWYHNGNLISGATGSSYTIPSAGTGDAGTYYVVVTDPYGSGNSATYTVTVNTPVPALPDGGTLLLAVLLVASAAVFLSARPLKT